MEKNQIQENARAKKVLIATDLKPKIMQGKSFLDRTDIAVFFATSNDEMLNIHIVEKLDLIVMKLDMPGHRSEEVYDIVRQSRKLRDVLLILVCEDTTASVERSKRCGAGAVLTMPVDPGQLTAKVQQFLNVAPRQSYRVILNVTVEGKFRNRPFLCRTENISSTGMLLRAALDLATNDLISCSFYLPNGTKVAATGEIMRSVQSSDAGERLYGIKYTAIEPDARTAIEGFVEKELQFNQ